VRSIDIVAKDTGTILQLPSDNIGQMVTAV